ncbi:MAG: polysaccharide deacetylase family protein [Nitrospirae bacterium YQR-1]
MLNKKSLKSLFATFAGAYFRVFKNSVLNNTLTVFLYHDVSNTPSEFSRLYNLNVFPDLFEFQIKYIKECFNVISPQQLISGSVPPRAAMVTFDDGLKGIFSNAVEILNKNEVPAVIFLNMEPISGEIFYSGLITWLCEKENTFAEHLLGSTGKEHISKPYFLHCTREIVNSWIKQSGRDFKNDVYRFTGPFASEDDLLRASESPYIYYANHLYNHDVALSLSDDELKASYMQNMEKLKCYKNYTNLFAFPFGQPETTFSEKQIEIILSMGADKVFSSLPNLNYSVHSPYLHRIALTDFNNTRLKILYQVFYNEMKVNYIFKSLKKLFSGKL